MSPIFLLPNEVLLLIFDINASHGFWSPLRTMSNCVMGPNDSEPLVITIRTSHVCQVWRQVSLNSPSLWRKLVNLNLLYDRPDLLNELILRTRNAPLWVKGTESVLYTTTSTRRLQNTLLVPFVQKHWGRMYNLRLSLNSTDLYQGMWTVISRHAPQLRNIEIDRSVLRGQAPQRWGSVKHLMGQQQLFADSAPFLRSFSCAPFPIHPAASWIPQLVDFHLDHYPFPVPHGILSALLRMSGLQELRFILKESTPQLEKILETPNIVAFNDLQDVVFDAEASVCQWFLTHLKASKRLQALRLLVQHATFEAIQAVLSQFTNMIVRSLAVSDLRLRFVRMMFSRRGIELYLTSNIVYSKEAAPNEVLFSIKTLSLAGKRPLDISSFALPPLPFVTHLSLDILTLIRSKRLPADLTGLMKSFITVTNISAPSYTISLLFQHGAALLPSLQVIKQTDKKHLSEDVITEFGLKRIACGYQPVQVLVEPLEN
ncbi:hypothetical protein CPB83DRAFT_859683 [Crepidotus variabilis]|uniref:F-box domain-containing protein n=1 Tax=Crepidotus variabilis TaxID=179855 RepID=A0A9P6JLZ4_9AGAR|nr:hypothetical protein CPB83DRAFT_859683 [Crepidotus variabilis]